MLSVEEALDRILADAGSQPVVVTDLADALGLVLAQPVSADIDSPPFHKSLMDGFAVRATDLPSGRGKLTQIGELLAGQTPSTSVGPGQAVQIMTGAPIPTGADSVVMIERTTLDGDVVTVTDPEFQVGQNIMPRGREFAADETVLAPGHRIGPAELGLLAAVGCVRPNVYRRPQIAIVSTGDEIVAPDEFPGPGKIRNSNESTLAAAARQIGADPVRLGIVGDNEQDMKERIGEGLKSDVLILSAGVSAGKRDLVPGVLDSLGVRQILHGVAFKPGKPLWVGCRENTLVFGLPGNPVAVLCCFEVFVKTALRARQGLADPKPKMAPMPLAVDFCYSTRRTTYHPARTRITQGGLAVEPVSWYGSPDLRALTFADALVVIPPGSGPHRAGDVLSVLPLGAD